MHWKAAGRRKLARPQQSRVGGWPWKHILGLALFTVSKKDPKRFTRDSLEVQSTPSTTGQRGEICLIRSTKQHGSVGASYRHMSGPHGAPRPFWAHPCPGRPSPSGNNRSQHRRPTTALTPRCTLNFKGSWSMYTFALNQVLLKNDCDMPRRFGC